MFSLKEVVQIDRRFENSINLQLDYEQYEKISSYIPTISSVKVMSRFLSNVVEDKDEKATILIGPYGKGKSHLLLVLLSFLTSVKTKKKRDILRGLVKKIDLVDEDIGQMFHLILSRNICLLPVIVSSTREDLNQAFLLGLHEALQREGLEHIRPETFFDVAVKVINQWKSKYPSTYQQLKSILSRRGKELDVFIQQLKLFQSNALDEFQEIYPMLTSGAVFNPMLHMQLLNLYRTVNHMICKQYGYHGIFIVFDEFSKFIEGHKQDTIIKNIKTLQDMCEFANFSREEQIHMVLVTHKNIQEYGDVLPMKVIHAFTGMEGRLSEILFVTSTRNNYELIQNTINVQKEKVNLLLEEKKIETQILKQMYYLPIFKNIFEEKDFYQKMIIGCFPLTPITAYFLIYISERVAQNERTLFTFMAKDGPYSLCRFIQEWTPDSSYWITPEAIYDYFSSIFRKNVADEFIHNSWLKAQYALKFTDDKIEKKLIKILALFEMLGGKEEILARKESLAFSLLVSVAQISDYLSSLQEKQIIIKRTRTDTYVFKNNIGVNVEKEIEKRVKASFQQLSLDKELEAISLLKYTFPRRYNQEYRMTRYFEYRFFLYQDFIKLASLEYLFEVSFSDGKIIALIIEKDEFNKKELQEKIKEWNAYRIIIIVPTVSFCQYDNLKRLLAIQALQKDSEFIGENMALLDELFLYEEDLIYEINYELDKLYTKSEGKSHIYHTTYLDGTIFTEKAMNELLNNICYNYYGCSPRVNHELVNRNCVSIPIRRARDRIISMLLEEKDMSLLLNGTSSEATIYRASLLLTGVISKEYSLDSGVKAMFQLMDEFIKSCEGKKCSFDILFQKLFGKDYGIREGIIPIFLAYRLSLLHDRPILYLGNVEVVLDVNILNNICERPKAYELFIDKQTLEKEEYIRKILDLFQLYGREEVELKGYEQLSVIVESMQVWYRTLPQSSRNISLDENLKDITNFRKLMKQIEINPREFLFEQLPNIFNCVGQYNECYARIEKTKKYLESVQRVLCKKVIRVTKKIVSDTENDNLFYVLKSWYEDQLEIIKHKIVNKKMSNIIQFIDRLNTFDENSIITKLSKIIIGVYIEDWGNDSFLKFQKELEDINLLVEELTKEHKSEKDFYVGKNRITFTTHDGTHIEKYYNPLEENSTSIFLKNALEEILEDFGESLELSQKIDVLAHLLERILTQ